MTKLELKRQLYALLIEMPDEEITDQELDLMVMLSQDREIQEYLQSKINQL